MKVKYTKLREDAIIPTRGSEKAAGYDLYACLEDSDIIRIPPHSTRIIGTGLSFELPDNTFAAIFARSGLATKSGLAPANKVGVCDSDYRGEYKIPLHNHTDSVEMVEQGDRIAQMVVMPFIPIELEEGELSDTARGSGGFGSTGV